MQYDGRFYAPIGDFLREAYLDYGFTRGTKQEVDFLVDLFALPTGSRMLDVGCGPGRHSLELARRGFQPVGVDISSGFIAVAQQKAAEEALPATFVVADARQLAFQAEFDAAICLCEGAFGLAGDESGHKEVLAGVSRALRPGALFVLTAINALSVVRKVQPGDPAFDPYTCTSVWTETVRNPEGEIREIEGFTTAFTYRELKLLLEAEGFRVEGGYGCSPGNYRGQAITVEDIEIMVVARRVGS